MAAERPRDRKFSGEDEANEREALGRCSRARRRGPRRRAAQRSVGRSRAACAPRALAPAPTPTPQNTPVRILFAFALYPVDTEAEIDRWAASYARLPPRHRALLGSVPAKVAAARAAARTNRHFIEAMLAAFDEDNAEAAAPPHLTGARGEAARIAEAQGRCPPGDVEKARGRGRGRAGGAGEERRGAQAAAAGALPRSPCRPLPAARPPPRPPRPPAGALRAEEPGA
jgi:hypothetical protein